MDSSKTQIWQYFYNKNGILWSIKLILSHNMNQRLSLFSVLYHSLLSPHWRFPSAISNIRSTFKAKFMHSLLKKLFFSHLHWAKCLFFYLRIHSFSLHLWSWRGIMFLHSIRSYAAVFLPSLHSQSPVQCLDHTWS